MLRPDGSVVAYAAGVHRQGSTEHADVRWYETATEWLARAP